MQMEFELYYFLISTLLKNTFIIASIFNLVLSQKVFELPLKKVQNVIGVIYLLFSLSYLVGLFFFLFKSWYNGVEYHNFQLLSIEQFKIFIWFIPFIISIANAFKKLRTSKKFVLVSIVLLLLNKIVFFESPKEPISVYNFYDNSTIQTLINGVILYFLIIFIFKRKRIKT